MNKLKKLVGIYWPLIVFSIISILGVIVLYHDSTSIISEFYKTLDTATAVALSVLAFIAYFQYSTKKSKIENYLERLDKIESLNNRDALVGIQIGGSNRNSFIDMQKFAAEKNIDKNLILIKQFGDENNNITKDDLKELENYLKNEVMPLLSGADKIHLLVSGIGIASYVCADIFSNWKPILVYHRNKNGKYELWTTDNKSREKIEASLKEVQ